jgi:TonB family protein
MEGFLFMAISIKNGRCGKTIPAVILPAILIFIMISLSSQIAFALQSDNKIPAQKPAKDQEYPAPNEFVPADKPPVPKYAPQPAYPEKAKLEGIEGEVWVKALVDSHGNVVKALIAKGPEQDAGFKESALGNARLCKYEPAEMDGKPVAVWIAYKLVYKLK